MEESISPLQTIKQGLQAAVVKDGRGYEVDHQARHTRQFSHCATSAPFSLSPPVPDRQRWDCRCRKPAGSDDGSNF